MIRTLAALVFVAGATMGQITWSDGVAVAAKEAEKLDRLVLVYVWDSV